MKSIILMFGPAGCGKFTIAKEICKIDPSLKLIHNHHINNVIFELVNPDGKTKLPPYVWKNIDRVREAVLDTIRETDRNEGYIFTNVMVNNRKYDLSVYEEIREIATNKGMAFCPIRISISLEELCVRIASEGRREMMKDITPENAIRFMQESEILVPVSDDYLDLDVRNIPPEQSAALIMDWVSSNEPQSGP